MDQKKLVAIGGIVVVIAFMIAFYATGGAQVQVTNHVEDQTQVQTLDVQQVDDPEPLVLATDVDKRSLGYSIDVNGKTLVTVNTLEEAQRLLEAVKGKYVDDPSRIISYSYQENVELILREVQANSILPEEEATNYVLAGSEELETYVVSAGDTIWDIAQKKGLSVNKIVLANPQVDVNRLQIGHQLNLNIPVAYINVHTVEEKVYSERIPYEVVYENSDKLNIGERQTKKSGVYGVKESKVLVTRQNGIVIDQESLGEEVVKEPENAVILAGIKIPGNSIASAFVNPSTGNLTSRFGSRWGRQHTGIDIGTPIGTPIMASEDGTVTIAGWVRGYGYSVYINHAEGYQTIYAHASKLLVKQGDTVKKGQIIALSGDTGNTTGPCVHFEVLKNGKPVDPEPFVNY